MTCKPSVAINARDVLPVKQDGFNVRSNKTDCIEFGNFLLNDLFSSSSSWLSAPRAGGSRATLAQAPAQSSRVYAYIQDMIIHSSWTMQRSWQIIHSSWTMQRSTPRRPWRTSRPWRR